MRILTVITTLIFAITGLLGASGCSVFRNEPCEQRLKRSCDECNEEPPEATICNTGVETDLLAAANSIEKSLNTLAAAQEVESPPIINTAPLITPEGGMGGRVDIDWTGPVAPLINKIAKMTDYRVKFLGNEPAIPIVITITAKRTLLAEVLQNASFQAGKRAHILVFPENRVIEVRYLPA